MWKTGSNKKVIFSDILSFISNSLKYESRVVVGTDSQPHREGSLFVTAITVMSDSVDYDCRYFYLKHPPKVAHGLFDRLFSETQHSLDIASEIRESIPSVSIEIHLDISPSDSKSRTSQYANSLVSLVHGYGYNQVKVKPESWCASAIADFHSK
jgi:predicted RNase H-related nuclease YkuK (DUF458 family)